MSSRRVLGLGSELYWMMGSQGLRLSRTEMREWWSKLRRMGLCQVFQGSVCCLSLFLTFSFRPCVPVSSGAGPPPLPRVLFSRRSVTTSHEPPSRASAFGQKA